jgi:hemerythrin-like domain-containing protein
MGNEEHRRNFLAASAASALLAACAHVPPRSAEASEQDKAEEEVSPVEDLMREHGVLRRLLLLYEEGVRRIESQQLLPPAVLASTTELLRRFIEDYHEKLEEDFVFPHFEKANRLVDLVTVLRQQHQAGRRVTDTIQGLSTPAALQSDAGRSKLATAIREYIRMYGPHAAREDTVLFTAFRALLGEKAYMELGEAFEDKEHALFGPRGFEDVVVQVAQLEQALGIYDLTSFTPR